MLNVAESDTKWPLSTELWTWRFFFFFLKISCWKEKAFSGNDLLIDIHAVLTQFLCEAFKRVLEIWPTDSGKKASFCSDAHGWLCEGLMSRWTRSSLLCHDLTRGQHTSTSLLIPYDTGHALNYLMEKRWIFPEPSHRISGCCWKSWQHLTMFILGKPSFWM